MNHSFIREHYEKLADLKLSGILSTRGLERPTCFAHSGLRHILSEFLTYSNHSSTSTNIERKEIKYCPFPRQGDKLPSLIKPQKEGTAARINCSENIPKFSSNCQPSITLEYFSAKTHLPVELWEILGNCIGCQNIFEDSTAVATSAEQGGQGTHFCPRLNWGKLGQRRLSRVNLRALVMISKRQDARCTWA